MVLSVVFSCYQFFTLHTFGFSIFSPVFLRGFWSVLFGDFFVPGGRHHLLFGGQQSGDYRAACEAMDAGENPPEMAEMD
jgi:hypothetical protein